MYVSNISLHPAVPSDFETLARIEGVAFQDADFSLLAFGPRTEAFILKRAEGLANLREPGKTNKFTKAVKTGEDGEEEIVGWAQWTTVIAKDMEAKEMKSAEEEEKEYSWAASPRYFIDSFVRGDEIMLRACEGKDHIKLDVLVILPEYQKRGIGSLLLDEGLKEADDAGLQAVLCASPEGEGLYLKRGFLEYERVSIKMWEYQGGEGMGVDEHAIMYRPAKPRGSTLDRRE